MSVVDATAERGRPSGSRVAALLAETVVHTVLFPGTIALGVPWLLAAGDPSAGRWAYPVRVVGILPVVAGIVLLAWCTWDFIAAGHGTPNPVDPPRFLVSRGPYRIVRNPMYVGVVLIVFGESLLLGSSRVLLYAAALPVLFTLFVLGYEEPTLIRLFGAAYDEYRRAVPRWIPRLRRPGRAS